MAMADAPTHAVFVSAWRREAPYTHRHSCPWPSLIPHSRPPASGNWCGTKAQRSLARRAHSGQRGSREHGSSIDERLRVQPAASHLFSAAAGTPTLRRCAGQAVSVPGTCHGASPNSQRGHEWRRQRPAQEAARPDGERLLPPRRGRRRVPRVRALAGASGARSLRDSPHPRARRAARRALDDRRAQGTHTHTQACRRRNAWTLSF